MYLWQWNHNMKSTMWFLIMGEYLLVRYSKLSVLRLWKQFTLKSCMQAFLILLIHQHEIKLTQLPVPQGGASVSLRTAMCTCPPCCMTLDRDTLNWWSNVNKLLDCDMSAHESAVVKKAVRRHLSLIRGCRPLQLNLDQIKVLARHFKGRVCSFFCLDIARNVHSHLYVILRYPRSKLCRACYLCCWSDTVQHTQIEK